MVAAEANVDALAEHDDAARGIGVEGARAKGERGAPEAARASVGAARAAGSSACAARAIVAAATIAPTPIDRGVTRSAVSQSSVVAALGSRRLVSLVRVAASGDGAAAAPAGRGRSTWITIPRGVSRTR